MKRRWDNIRRAIKKGACWRPYSQSNRVGWLFDLNNHLFFHAERVVIRRTQAYTNLV